MPSFADDFNRANATSIGTPSDAGAVYAGATTLYGTTGNELYSSGVVGWANPLWRESSSAAGELFITLRAINSMSSGLVFRLVDSSNYLLAQFTPTAMFLWQRVAAGFTQIGSTYTGTVSVGDLISVAFNGSSLSLRQGGVQRVSGTSSTHLTATKHGFVENNGNSCRYDELNFVDAGGAPTPSLIYLQPAMGPLLVR